MSLKKFPVQYALQSVAEAGIALRRRLGERIDEIDHVEVRAAAGVLENTTDVSKRRPTNRETADHSLFSVLAMALRAGRVGVSEMQDALWGRDDVVALGTRVSGVTPQGWPSDAQLHVLPVEVEVRLVDGEIELIRVDGAPGSAVRPLTSAEVIEKFHSNVAGLVTEDEQHQIIAAVDDMLRDGCLSNLRSVVDRARVRASRGSS